jgi:hypothetical protein
VHVVDDPFFGSLSFFSRPRLASDVCASSPPDGRAAIQPMSVRYACRHALLHGRMRLAGRPSVTQWLSRIGRRPSTVSTAEVLETLDEWRGDWPDAGR